MRPETSPEDVAGMYAAEGIVTARGGRTSHAAVVAVGMGKPAWSAPGTSPSTRSAACSSVGGRIVREGDVISVDGTTGEVILDAVKTVEGRAARARSEESPGLGRPLPHEGSACGPTPTRRTTPPGAREFGAEGIGLVPHRAHVLRGRPHPDRARDDHGRATRRRGGPPLDKLLPFQRDDFIGIFRAMDGLPVTIRLLDPPLHEFLPTTRSTGSSSRSEARLDALGINPDAGQPLERDDRQGATRCARPTRCSATAAAGSGSRHPEIYGMQVRAIMEAACTVAEQGVQVEPEIMIPLTGTVGRDEADATSRPSRSPTA